MHTKFQDHQHFGSGEEDFLRFLTYVGMATILVMWPWPFEQTFVPPSHRSSISYLTLIGPVVSEEKMSKKCGRRRWTTTEAYLSYKLTKWAFGSGELKYISKLWFLRSACRPMLVNIYIKFHEDILNGFQVREWTQFCDKQMTMAKATLKGGDSSLFNHKMPPNCLKLNLNFYLSQIISFWIKNIGK